MSQSPPPAPPAPTHTRLWLAELSLLSVALIWGVNIPLMKTALGLEVNGRTIDPYAFNAIRLVISALVLQGFAWREYRSGIRPSGELSKGRVLVYAVLISIAYQLLFLLAVERAGSADISLIMATVPMWTALSARVFLKEMLPRMAWVGLIIAFAGTLIVTVQKPVVETASQPIPAGSGSLEAPEKPTGGGDSQNAVNDDTRSRMQSRRFLGNVLSLLAALAWAGGTVYSRPLLKSISPTQLSAWSATIGLPFHLGLAWFVIPASLPLLSNGELLFYLLYSGTLSTGLALAMWSFGVKTAGAAQAAIFQNLTPIFAITSAWLWRGETVSTGQTVGGLMIIGGLIIMRRSR